jgi:spermidine synthase
MTPFEQPGTTGSPRNRPLLVLLFVGSGCAALIYEIVWLQLLQLVIGSSAVSLGLLLGTFMGGMCVGSLTLAKIIPASRHPLRVYAALELGMAALGLIVLFAVPAVGRIYAPHAGQGFVGILLRGLVASVCLLPPTFLMGATLPAISRWVESTADGMAWLGFFYGGNTVGAVIGCLLAGFYLLRVHDMAVATMVAAAINVAVGVSALLLASLTPHRLAAATWNPKRLPAAAGSKLAYLAIALSGMTALAAEVIWTRLLSLMLGATVYTFSIILAVFLAGLGLGSMAGSIWARRSARPNIALGWCQLFLAAAMSWAASYMLNPSQSPPAASNPWFTFQLDLLSCLWALLPATFLWGASFPLALATLAQAGSDPGRVVGKVYAANTVGAILGALATSLYLIAAIGTQNTQRLLIALTALSGAIVLFPALRHEPTETAPSKPDGDPGLPPVAALLIAVIAAAYLAWNVPPLPWQLVAHGRYLATYGEDRTLLYLGEGLNASVAVTRMKDSGFRNFHVSGKVEASTFPPDMRLQRMLGHLPALVHPNPGSILVVGCGAGVTAGSFLTYAEITNITICEIEPLIPRFIAPFFARENYDLVNNSRVKIHYDDARHFVLISHEKFDVITSDPIHPWVKGAATLYTQDYFQMCRDHLNPGGVVTQWVPLYESDEATVKSEMATFFKVFPNGTVWNNPDKGAGYDTVLLGTVEPLKINVDQLQARLLREPAVADSLKDVGFATAISLLSTYGGQASSLQSWLAGAQINNDRNLRLQFIAGLAADLNRSSEISASFMSHREFPENIFYGAHSEALRLAFKTKVGQ